MASEGLRRKLTNIGGARVSPTQHTPAVNTMTSGPSSREQNGAQVTKTEPAKNENLVKTQESDPGNFKPLKNFLRRFDHNDERKRKRFRDNFKVSSESWILMLFTFFVGSFFVCGGIYLMVSGAENNVIDFVVVGGMGVIIGATFGGLGCSSFVKRILKVRKARLTHTMEKKEQEEMEEQEEYKAATVVQTTSIAVTNTVNKRRPSNAQLYGPDGLETTFSSKASTQPSPPPPLMVPTEQQDSGGKNLSVRPVVFTEATRDDIPAITHAAKSQSLSKSTRWDVEADYARVSVDSRESTEISIRDADGDLIVRSPSDCSDDELHGNLLLETSTPNQQSTTGVASFNDTGIAPNPEVVVQENDTDNVPPPATPDQRKRVLSATNERRLSAQYVQESDKETLKDGIPVEPFSYAPPRDDVLNVLVRADNQGQSVS